MAADAGVSLATASRALNGSVRNVTPALKDRVLASAARLGYLVNVPAQAVARGTTNSVAVVIGDITDPYFASIASGVIEVARIESLAVTVTSLSVSDVATEYAEALAAAALRAQRPRAVVFAAGRPTTSSWKAFTGLERLVVIGPDSAEVPSLPIDNRAGAASLGTALIDLGYREFVVFSSNSPLAAIDDRVSGFTSVVGHAETTEVEFSRDGGYRAMADLLSTGSTPECVFATADVMALGAMSAVRDAGLRPGVDVAIAGFDDIPVLGDVSPGLTTVALPLREIGMRALTLALADEDGPTAPIPGQVLRLWGAQMAPGAAAVGEAIELPATIVGADAVITGEGRFDSQTAAGKVPAYVTELARQGGIPALLAAGAIAAPTTEFANAVALTEIAGGASAAMGEPIRWARAAGAALAERFDG